MNRWWAWTAHLAASIVGAELCWCGRNDRSAGYRFTAIWFYVAKPLQDDSGLYHTREWCGLSRYQAPAAEPPVDAWPEILELVRTEP